MRTTIDIADDVLVAIKELARRERRSAGDVLSDLARRALTGASTRGTTDEVSEPPACYGFKPFPSNGTIVTNDQIDDLRDEEAL